MSALHRRRFLGTAALGAAGLLAAARRAMRITDLEIHEVLLPYHDYNATALFRYHGLNFQTRAIYILKTDVGLEGYGESYGVAPKKEAFAKYLGTDPFDWLADRENLPINSAVYDLMGKYLGVPAWKLLGPQVRSWVPVGAWTISRPPEAMAEEVLSVSRRGYHWLKYHVDHLQNVIDQTAAMQKAAPRGFKIHYDFNGDSNVEAMYPVLKELEKFPVAGRVEDPVKDDDHDGYRMLRAKCALPILVHHGAPSLEYFLLHQLCDGFMAGHAPVGQAIRLAALAETTNTPFMLQQSGGTITRAFLAHEAAVFRMAAIDHVDICHLWKEDVTVETLPVVGGSVEVPDRPGIGVSIDRAKLEKYARAPRPRQSRFLVRVRYANGPHLYFRFDPDAPEANLRFLNPPGKGVRDAGFGPHAPGPVPGYANPVASDFWDAEGSEEFERMWKRTESGPVWNEGGK
jgi:L-alanine-DL-glutamate epimerase-like enolase superfamily enzyme